MCLKKAEKVILIVLAAITLRISRACYSPREASSRLRSAGGGCCFCSAHILFISSSTEGGRGTTTSLESSAELYGVGTRNREVWERKMGVEWGGSQWIVKSGGKLVFEWESSGTSIAFCQKDSWFWWVYVPSVYFSCFFYLHQSPDYEKNVIVILKFYLNILNMRNRTY